MTQETDLVFSDIDENALNEAFEAIEPAKTGVKRKIYTYEGI